MRHPSTRQLGLLLLATLVAVPAQAQHCELLGASDGPSLAVAAQGNLAVIGNGLWLKCLDLTDPAHPILRGQLLLPGVVRDIELRDSLAYVAADNAGLRIVDLHNPDLPVPRGYCSFNAASRITVTGDRALIASVGGFLAALDVSDPDAPVRSVSVFSGGSITDLASADSLAFVASQTRGLSVYDLRDPSAPVLLSQLSPAPMTTGVAAAGQLVFLSTYDGVLAYDLSEPTAPHLVGACEDHGGSGRLSLQGNRLFRSTDCAVQALDVSDPGHPTVLGELILGCGLDALSAENDRALLADAASGLRVLDVQNPAQMTLTAQLAKGLPAEEVVARESVAFALGRGLQSYDLSTPSHPTLLCGVDNGGVWPWREMDLEDDVLAVAADDSGLLMFDAADPTALGLLGQWTTERVTGVDLSDGVAFALHSDSCFTALTHWDNPLPLGTWTTHDTYATQVVAQSGVAFVRTLHGLEAVDFHDPATPGLLDQITGLPETYAMALDGDMAGLSVPSVGLAMIDVGTPAALHLRPMFHTAYTRFKLALSEHRAYLMNPGALSVLDIGNPNAPVSLAEVELPGSNPSFGRCLAVTGDLVLAARQDAGLLVLRLVDETDLHPISRPESATLLRAWPNPFNPTSTVEYELPRFGPVHIELYDLAGRLVRVLASGEQGAGRHSLRVDGAGLASGVYLLKLTTPAETRGLKLLLLR